MANKQTAGLQLIDLKGIELANGPVKIKGVYQQVIANKFIKTITNLVYDGYAYDDFPITLTTTDGLTYTGKYIDTVSSEMLQWLSITINNKSEVTVTKELFEGGGGGYEEMTFEEFKADPESCSIITIKPISSTSFPLKGLTREIASTTFSKINSINYDETGTNINSIDYQDKTITYVPSGSTTSSNISILYLNTQYIFRRNGSQLGIPTSNTEIIFSSLLQHINSSQGFVNYVLTFNKSAKLLRLSVCPFWSGTNNQMYKDNFITISERNNIIKFYRDKNVSKLLESI